MVYTVGYGGKRDFEHFFKSLSGTQHGSAADNTLVDVRINPRCTFCKDFDGHSLEKLLGAKKWRYIHAMELGNIWRGKGAFTHAQRMEQYEELLEVAGELLTRRLRSLPNGCVILCGCKDVAQCHRGLIAKYLSDAFGYRVVHL